MLEPEIVEELMPDITIEDLPTDDLREVARIIGLDNTVRLCNEQSGLTLYLPTGVVSTLKQKYVLKHYDGGNSKRLASATGLSLSGVHAIIAKSRKARKGASK